MTDSEPPGGHVIDVRCVRKNAREDLRGAAETHTRECALTGHCVESGYALVTDDDRLALLDASATPDVVELVERSERERGHRARATREKRNDEMTTTSVEEV